MEFSHISVLPKESVSMLNINPKGIYVDGTLGGGGHSALICSELSDEGRLVGIDRDDAAIAAATERLKNFKCKITLCRDNFFNVKNVIAELGIDAIDGAVLDLGVSSPQLDVPERGFSYNSCARLDMRMDRRAELDAYTVVNTYDEKRLADMDITISFTDEAVSEISDAGFDESYGARPLRRAIQTKIEDRLSEQMLEGKVVENSEVVCDYKDNEFVFETK